VTLSEQGSVEYINDVDAQQLARLLLARELGPNTSLVNSTIQIGTPVVEEVSDLGVVTMKVRRQASRNTSIRLHRYKPS